jgi:membrane-bound serine protease (ClpP class)
VRGLFNVYTHRKLRALLILILLLVACTAIFILFTSSVSSESGNSVCVVHLDMAIDEGAVTFVKRAFDVCKGYGLVVLAISSNGGYLSSAQKIVNMVSQADVPCISWVPPGSQAYSAATIVAFSCKALYMGSGSAIGAVKPYPYDEKTAEAVRSLLTSLMVRMCGDREEIRQLASDMVVNARAIDDSEAIKLGIAKKADTVDDVVRSVLGVATAGKNHVYPGAWEKLLSVLSNPVVYSIMLTAGALLIVVEVLTTGFQGYGIAGALLILLALYGMSIVPPDVVALALLLSGATLLAIEMFTPGFGVFGISGVVLMAIGIALTVYTTPLEVISPAVYVVSVGLGSFAALALFIGFKGAQAMRMKRRGIVEEVVGSIGIAKTDIGETQPGVVYVAGEDWSALSVRGSIPQGSKVRVVRVEGLRLYVEKLEEHR